MKNTNKKDSITEEELKELKEKVIESLSIDRQRILFTFPFFGNILLKMNLIPIRDCRVPTACTDGRNVYFDISFYKKLSSQERVFVLAHEVGHCVMMHLVRCQTRDKMLYNIASDMEINNLLVNETNQKIMIPPNDLLFPPDNLKGRSAEVIYDWLLKEGKKNSKNQTGQSGSSSSNGFGSSDNSNSQFDNYNNRNNNNKKDSNLKGQFDNHQYSNSEKNDKDNSPFRKDEYGEVGFDKDFTPNVPEDFADRMRETIIQEIQRENMTGQGNIPDGLKSLLSEFTRPEISWKQLLQQFVCSCFGDKRRMIPPSRRHLYNEMYYPSRRSEKIKLSVIVDTSGSCWDSLNKFFSEINSLLKTFGDYEMSVVECDADVHNIVKYDNNNPFPIDNPKAINIQGCGGSDFRPAFNKIRKDGIENDVDCIIAITDGYITFPKYPPSKPTLIILTKDGNDQCCEWGRKIKFNSN